MAGLLSEPGDPRLPLDIERAVFECAAVLYPTSIPICMLVAVRVKEWYEAVSVSFMSHEVPPGRLEPILYRVLYCCTAPTDVDTINGFRIIPMDVLLELIRTKPPHFFRRTVRQSLPGRRHFLPNGIHSGRMQPRYQLIRVFYTKSASAHLRCPSASSASHNRAFLSIETLPPRHRSAPSRRLRNTHPSGSDGHGTAAHVQPHPSRAQFVLNDSELYNTLRSRTNLQCIVGLVQRPITTTEIHPFADDDRFVCIHQVTSYRMDWIIGAHTGYDYWAIADAFIAARRASKVDASRYIISDIDDSWRT
ncbi:hypothetical protein B0H14DRAFT_2683653 [Mycena olivaceomarginata]|nr:hypothetical protein B0H14DRAFT_2683653 [Mycena olivaceomarginata]